MKPTHPTLDRRVFLKGACAACVLSAAALSAGCGKGGKTEAETKKASGETAQIIAKCGIICSECEAYTATQNQDRKALVEIAKKWSQQYNAEITPESILCDGCQADEGNICDYAEHDCRLRQCARAQGVANCAHCEHYPCPLVEEAFKMAPEAKAVLEGVRERI